MMLIRKRHNAEFKKGNAISTQLYDRLLRLVCYELVVLLSLLSLEMKRIINEHDVIFATMMFLLRHFGFCDAVH
jgi:hypothetical protein